MAEIAHIERHERWTHSGPVSSVVGEEQLSALEQTSRATVAAAEPMGLWTFATGTWIVGTVFAGAFVQSGNAGIAMTPAETTAASVAATTAVVPVLLVLAGLAQFIAGLFSYRRANVLAATAFCSIGAFYVTVASFFVLEATGALPGTGTTNLVLGFLLESFAFIALALTAAAMKESLALVAVYGLLTVGYALAGIPYLTGAIDNGGPGLAGSIGGWFMVASAFFAYLAGAGIVVNSMWERRIMPFVSAR